MSDPVESQLYAAAHEGLASEVSSLLRDHPGLDVHWENQLSYFQTALHTASVNGHVDVVKLLLAHPNIKVNLRQQYGRTPFALSCANGNEAVIRVLLKDSRIDITLADHAERTPLWIASCSGHDKAIEWLIASGRELGDVKNKKGKHWDDQEYTALEIATKKDQAKATSVLERFIANPAQTRYEIRVKLEVLDEVVTEVFALIIFLCDGLLQLKPASEPAVTLNQAVATAGATRFFVIVKRLPMELQMILCHRVMGSARQNILRKDSEAAFKSLAAFLLLPCF